MENQNEMGKTMSAAEVTGLLSQTMWDVAEAKSLLWSGAGRSRSPPTLLAKVIEVADLERPRRVLEETA